MNEPGAHPLIHAVAQHFGTAASAIICKNTPRDEFNTVVRHCCCWFLHRRGFSGTQIARFMGRDDGTVSAALVSFKARLDTIPKFREHIAALEMSLTAISDPFPPFRKPTQEPL